jgi:vacuolar iron transporter family protein
MPVEHNPDFIHHVDPRKTSLIREVVFGMEDGMVSTLGAVTGIATATGSYFMIALSGLVVIAVESISMGVGSYLSNKSEQDMNKRKVFEEKSELKNFPAEERDELRDIYLEDGWPKGLAETMADTASKDKKLFLKEMIYHELEIGSFQNEAHPFKKGLVMFVSYMLGGLTPLLPYLVIKDIFVAIPVSVGITLVGLFLIGVGTTKFSKRKWWKAGFEMLGLASLAALIGYGVGQVVDYFWLK